MFINLHILTTIGYSNLNRDDTGAPKTCYIGTTQRARISSQALKRAKRLGFESEPDGGETTYRSKFIAQRLQEKITTILETQGITVEEGVAEKIRTTAQKKTQGLTHKNAGDDAEKGTLIWIAEKELAITNPTTESLTIAAFGRMFAERPDLQTEASLQVGHAITTHEAVTDLDYFNAADDLRSTYMNDAGAGHLDVAQYTSGVFYLPISIDVNQLLHNWTGHTQPDAPQRLKKFVQHVLLDLPSGKQNSTAAKTLPSFLYAEISPLPISYAGAFESAVESDSQGGYQTNSVKALQNDIAKAKKFIPQDLQGASITVDGGENNSHTIDDLTNFVVEAIMGQFNNTPQLDNEPVIEKVVEETIEPTTHTPSNTNPPNTDFF